MPEPIGVAVIGTGSIADAHLYSYQKAERARLVAVCDVVESRAARAAERFEAESACGDYRELLRRDDVHAISICTPPALHVDISVEALRAGKHVLCEKPVSPTLAGLDAIAEAQRASGKVFSGVFQLRFGKGAQQLRIAVDEGRLGRVHLGVAETLWYRGADYFSVPWRATWAEQCGGVTVSQAIHLLDALIWYLGEPKTVFAQADEFRGLTECEETCVAVVRFAGGAVGQITSTVVATGPEKSRLELYGTEASAVSQGTVYDATASAFEIGCPDPKVAQDIHDELEERVPRGYTLLHRPQVEDFLDSIIDGREPLVGVPQCREALQLTAGVYKSAMTGERVDLPLVPDDPWYRELPPSGVSLR
jgi:UDP-N-acetyl-2-amino-2-deoxyglucuronate dehydrogenase